MFNATVYYNYTDKSITPTGKSIPASTGAITSEATDLSDEIATPGKYTRAGFVPGSQAVLMLFKGTAEDYKTDQSSLLYITQTTVDENGTAEFTTYGEFTDTYWVAMIYGKCGHTDIQWVNCKNATVLQDGMEICLCTKCGEVIDSKTVVAEKPEHTLGDVNLDGKININDATAMQRAIANMTTLNDRQLISADVNKDGELNINDVTLLQKYLVDLVPYLGVQQ